ncbi:MAG: flavin reductase family protein [bacterium]|nr:flavin reductase family protein [bacterium]
MYLDTRTCESDWPRIYMLATSFIQPRPIGFISSVSDKGVRNLAPYSFYNMVSANPPVVMFAPASRRDGGDKDSLHNAEATGEFVVATVTEDLVERMNQCAFDYPPDADEFERSGLTPAPATLVKPALVAESPVNIECKLLEIKRFGDQPGAGRVVFGRIVAIHVDDAYLAEDGMLDAAKLQAVGRMGRSTYSRTNDTFDLSRPENG